MDRFHQLAMCLAYGLACILSGCCADCGRLMCDGSTPIPPGAIPHPTGAHVGAWQTTQHALAKRDALVIYQYEWKGESAELGPFGQRHVSGLVQRLETPSSSIILEPSESDSLDTDRQASLVALLTARGVSDAESRISVGYATAEGLRGQESQRLEQGYFRGGLQGRGSGGGLGGGFGGTSGLGAGGGFGGMGGLR